MKPIEKHLCSVMHDFVGLHISEVKDSYDSLGFKNSRDMLSQIKKDPKVALWALTELCAWGLAKDYFSEFVVDETEIGGYVYFTYRLGDKFVYVDEDNNGKPVITEVEKITEIIEVTRWKKLE